MSRTAEDGHSVLDEAFPAPSYWKYQRKAIQAVYDALDGHDVVALSAPTGSGKSLMNYTAAGAYGTTVYTTPQNSLVDQLDEDEFIGDKILTIKGRNNYDCIHQEDRGTPVDEAVCQRDDDFDCELKEARCPYYRRRYEAVGHPFVVTNLPMLMTDSSLPEFVPTKLPKKDVLVVDEAQNIESAAINFVGLSISKFSVTKQVMGNVKVPKGDGIGIDDARALVEKEVKPGIRDAIDHIATRAVITSDSAKRIERLEEIDKKMDRFLDDEEDRRWVANKRTEIVKNGDNWTKVSLKPVSVGRFLDSLLWNRGRKVILSSATIPDEDWFDEIGLGNKNVKKINVSSTFPPENRPVITEHAVGKMTYNKRKDNALPMAKKIQEIAEHHGGEKGIVHCRAYSIRDLLKRAFVNNGMEKWFRNNVVVQDGSDREGSLKEWQNSDKPLFFSVAMSEGLDLPYDDCRYQILAKVLYPSMKDERVKYRVEEMDDWDWMNRHAAIQIQQATGRAVRAEDDEAVMYLLDKSAKGLIQREAEMFETWFLNALDFQVRGQDPDRAVSWQ